MAYAGPCFDADNHVVERAEDLNLYVPKPFRETHLIESRQVGQACPWFVGGKMVPSRQDCNRPGGLIPRPGSLKAFMLALAAGDEADYQYIPVTPDIADREGRLARMDALGIEASMIFPSEFLAVLAAVEAPDARHALTRAFNQWFEERWGFNHHGRIYATPAILMNDLDQAVTELEWAIRHDARVILMPYGPVNGRSPADSYFDPFWARVNEARLVVALHLGQNEGGTSALMTDWGEAPKQQPLRSSAFYFMHALGEAPLMHMLSSLIFWNLFERFPNLRMMSVENGCEWVPAFLRKMDKSRASTRNGPWPGGPLKQRPSEIFRQCVGVTPFPEDDVKSVVERVGDDFLCMGSDWPHPEGVAAPADFVAGALKGVEGRTLDKIMYENARRLIPAR